MILLLVLLCSCANDYDGEMIVESIQLHSNNTYRIKFVTKSNAEMYGNSYFFTKKKYSVGDTLR